MTVLGGLQPLYGKNAECYALGADELPPTRSLKAAIGSLLIQSYRRTDDRADIMYGPLVLARRAVGDEPVD